MTATVAVTFLILQLIVAYTLNNLIRNTNLSINRLFRYLVLLISHLYDRTVHFKAYKFMYIPVAVLANLKEAFFLLFFFYIYSP